MTPQRTAERLTRIADEMARAKPGSPTWNRLQAELDSICGTEEKPRDRGAEAAWERQRRPVPTGVPGPGRRRQL